MIKRLDVWINLLRKITLRLVHYDSLHHSSGIGRFTAHYLLAS